MVTIRGFTLEATRKTAVTISIGGRWLDVEKIGLYHDVYREAIEGK